MLSNIKQLFFGPEAASLVNGAANNSANTLIEASVFEIMPTEAEDDWILVDCIHPGASPTHPPYDEQAQAGGDLVATILVDEVSAPVNGNDLDEPDNVEELPNVQDGVRQVRRKIDESWLVTPPPCFTSRSLSPGGNVVMENLLIEHPSMSVYSMNADSFDLLNPCTSVIHEDVETASMSDMVTPSRSIDSSLPRSTDVQPAVRTSRAVQSASAELRQIKSAEIKRQQKDAKTLNKSALDRAFRCQIVVSQGLRPRTRREKQKLHSGKSNNRKQH